MIFSYPILHSIFIYLVCYCTSYGDKLCIGPYCMFKRSLHILFSWYCTLAIVKKAVFNHPTTGIRKKLNYETRKLKNCVFISNIYIMA